MASPSLVLLGGRRNMKRQYMEVIKEFGYKPKILMQKVHKLDTVIGRPKAIIVVRTQISHRTANEGVFVAKKNNIPVLFCKSSINSVMDALIQLNNIEPIHQKILVG